MRLSKDNNSWKAQGILRRDFRHSKTDPEIGKPSNHRNTKRWCKGKTGVLHVKKWVKRTDLKNFWNQRCEKCGKIFDYWYNRAWFKNPKPKEILDE